MFLPRLNTVTSEPSHAASATQGSEISPVPPTTNTLVMEGLSCFRRHEEPVCWIHLFRVQSHGKRIVDWKPMNLLVNFLLYQIGWFAIVLGAGSGRPWLGSMCALALVAVHFAMVGDWPRHLLLGGFAMMLGVLLDSVQLGVGVFEFTSGSIAPWLVPPWIAVLWIQFATILPFCLRWLSARYGLSSLLGFIGGPLAFSAGERLGAVVFLPPRLPHSLILAVVWALALPTLVFCCDRVVGGGRDGSRYRWASRGTGGSTKNGR